MSHHGTNGATPYSDEWYTPQEVFDWLGGVQSFDLDPWPSPQGRVPSHAIHGFCAMPKLWCNPPFSIIDECVKKYAPRPDWCWIAFCRMETKWMQKLLARSDAVWFPPKRVRFIDGRLMVKDKDTGEMVDNKNFMTQRGSPGAPCLIAARGTGVVNVEYARERHGGALLWRNGNGTAP